MKLSEWLTGIVPYELYPEVKLTELEDLGIGYDAAAGVLTSRLDVLTMGRLAGVDYTTPRAAMTEAAAFGRSLRFLPGQGADERYVWGFGIIVAIWRLVVPVLEWGEGEPPSALFTVPEEKAQVDLAALRRYGY
jgi:hypothetical protein